MLLTNLSTIKGMWSNKTLCVALAPDQITLIVRRGKEVLPDTAVGIPLNQSDGSWKVAVAALRAWLQTSGESVAGLPMSVSVSNRWCHLMMLPWSDDLLDEDQARRFAQAQFAGTFGEAAFAWRFTMDDAPYGQTRLACAMEGDLLDALGKLAEQAGHRLVAIESALSIAGRALGQHRPMAFALQEKGRVVLAHVDKGRIVGVQAQPCQGNWNGELAQAWRRWTLRSPELSAISSVALVRLDDTPPVGPLGDVFDAVRLPSHTLAPGFAAVCMMEA